MTRDAHFNIPIDTELRAKFKAKYPNMAGDRVVELIKEDLGLSKSSSELEMERVQLEQQLDPIHKRLEEIYKIIKTKEEKDRKTIDEKWDQFILDQGWSKKQMDGWFPNWKGMSDIHPWWNNVGVSLSREDAMKIYIKKNNIIVKEE